MRLSIKQSIPIVGALVLICFMLQQCDQTKQTNYHTLICFADEIKVINTHEHQRWPEENGDLNYRLSHLIQGSYLNSDIVSAGGQGFDWRQLDSLDMEAYWGINGRALDYTRSTSYYSHFIEGFRKLYNFDELYFTEANIHGLSAQVEEKYADYRSWFDEAFHRAGFELMFLDQYWKPFNTDVEEKYYALVFHINPLVIQSSARPAAGDEGPEVFQRAGEDGVEIKSLDNYLEYCDHLFQKNMDNKAVCVKNSMAYSRSLDYEDVPFEEARQLFARPSADLTIQEAKKIQDFIFHWIIRKSVEYDLPIQIHTGYLAGNGNMLDNGKPVKLNNLFLKYPEAKFVLFHGGYPWTGEYAALGKMFSNVYLDLVWLPQISRQVAIQSLDEMFDAVPYNKFFWGGDCAFIEESTGSLEFGKSVVAEVLSMRIERGLLSEDVARDMIRCIFRDNAIQFFQLEEKLGKTF
ncbi:MAG: amidohydrolase family protein [Bacteroidales bacterium]|nr:amidohydrolase family protein [Bacteroidales bacterium]